jgi:hypothetical protein
MRIFFGLLLSIFVLLGNEVVAKPYWEFTKKELNGKNIALFGCFQCYSDFIKVMDYFESQGAKILCPIRSEVIDDKADFVLFKDDDTTKTERELQQSVFDKTRKYADIVYVVNEKCEVGLGTSSEVGYVLALNDMRKRKIKVLCWNKPQSSHIRLFCEY